MVDNVAFDEARFERLSFLLQADDDEAVAWRKELSRAEYIEIWKEYQALKQAREFEGLRAVVRRRWPQTAGAVAPESAGEL